MTDERKIKILYIVSTLKKTGPTQQLLGIIKNLDKRIYSPILLTLSPEPMDSMKKEFIETEIQIESLNYNRIEFLFKGTIIKRIINEFNADIIHTSGIRADSIVSTMNSNTPHCMTIHCYVFEDYKMLYGCIIGSLAAILHVSAMKKCNYVIFCSKTLKKMYEKILKNKATYYVQNGIDTEKYSFLFNIEEKRKLQLKLNIPHEKIIFLVVGHLSLRKDPITIIEAFKKADVQDKAILIFLGEGPLYDTCKQLIYNNRSIELRGKVENVYEYLKSSDIYVSASKLEGLPMSVLEAASSGLNLILSNIPQHKEIFESKMELVDFFNPADIDKLAMLIKKVSLNDNKQINQEIAQHIKKNFSDKTMSQFYQKIYQNILTHGKD